MDRWILQVKKDDLKRELISALISAIQENSKRVSISLFSHVLKICFFFSSFCLNLKKKKKNS